MSESYIYLHDFADETMPCAPTLEGWAAWLAKPDFDWDRDQPAKDGQAFVASVMDVSDHTVTLNNCDDEPTGEDLTFSPAPPTRFDYLVIREGPGSGWDVDDMCDDHYELRDHLFFEDIKATNVAVCVTRPARFTVVYHAPQGEQPAWCELKEDAP